MILMRRGEGSWEWSVIGLLTARTHVSMLRKSMRLAIRHYMSYSYQFMLCYAFVITYNVTTSFFPLKPFLWMSNAF